MHRLGISVYPEHSTPEADLEYLRYASSLGFSRIFTCLLSVDKPADEILRDFGAFISQAHDLGFVVAVDTNPNVFAHLGATPLNLEPFYKMGVDIIRLDGHFGDREDILITRNPYGIKIEFNASSNIALDTLIERGADSQSIVTCHNFYPEPFTGLSEEIFTRYSKQFRSFGLPVAAFVTSQEKDAFGPWPVFAGLPTLEDDRTRPIDLQVRHLVATGLIDDIIVGNCFASKDELLEMSQVDLTRTTMKLECVDGVTEDELDLAFNFQHTTRGDASAYLLRSSFCRGAYRGEGGKTVPVRTVDAPMFKRGDVLVVNDNLAHYRGELQVILTEIPNRGTHNLVGRIPKEELFLLDYIHPEHPFGFIPCKK